MCRSQSHQSLISNSPSKPTFACGKNIALFLFLTSLTSGCLSISTFESSRTLPSGELELTMSVEGGSTIGSLVTYQRESSNGGETESQHGLALEVIPAVKGSLGFTDWWSWSAALLLTGGLQIGTKVQLLGDQDSVFALGLHARGGVAAAGFGYEEIVLLDGLLALPIGLRMAEGHELTLSPRLLEIYYWRDENYEEDDPRNDTVSADALGWGAGLAYSHINPERTLTFEISALRLPEQKGNEEGGVLITGGFAFSASPESLWGD